MVEFNNVFWFLIDGLSPDFLKSCGNKKLENNFFDELLFKGAVFTDVAATAAGTHTSMHSIFSSLMPSCNGATGWIKEALRNFKQEIYTLTDVFKLSGYKTYRYCDADGERTVPMAGFDVWESSNYKISELLSSTDMCRTKRREQFIKEVNEYNGKKFVYHHNLLLHELNAKMGELWTSEGYLENIKTAASKFETLYEEYSISEDDLVIISSDHGVVLDIPWMNDGTVNGERHYEQSVKSFCALIGKGIPHKLLDKRISSLDIAPTLIKILFGLDYRHQGYNREQYLYDGEYISLPCYREKGSYTVAKEEQNPLSSDLYYVWENKWKYVYSLRDPRSEWLINLNENKDYEINLKEKFPDKVKSLKELINKNVIEPTIKEYLHEDRANMFPDKRVLNKYFSIVIDTLIGEEAWGDLFDIAGPYYELIYIGSKIFIPLKYKENYKLKIINKKITRREEILQYCSGKWCVFLDGCEGGYSEYFLSDLYRCIDMNADISGLNGKGFAAIRNDLNNSGEILNCNDLQVRCLKCTEKYALNKGEVRGILKKLLVLLKKIYK